MSQAAQYRLPEKVQLLSEVVDLTVPRAVGDAALGLISSMRYCFRVDNPKNKEFVALWQKEYGAVPDNNEGEQWQALQILAAGIEQAKSTETPALRGALETVAIDDIKGHVAIRKCDHQAIQGGTIVKLVKAEGFSYPVPQIVATFPGEQGRRDHEPDAMEFHVRASFNGVGVGRPRPDSATLCHKATGDAGRIRTIRGVDAAP